MRPKPHLNRRAFLRAAGAAFAATGTRTIFGQAPAIIGSQAARPSTAFGATAGDVDGDRAIVWSRTDRPSRLVVEYSTTESFAQTQPSRRTRRAGGHGFHGARRPGRACLRASESSIACSSRACPIYAPGASQLTGSFTTPPPIQTPRDVTIAWTADTVGQGWGINPDMGGMRLYEAMRRADADVFIHTGDTIYADSPLQPEVKLDDGRVWRNVVTPEKSKVAETLDEFRGNHRYNLLDEHVRRFNASISQFVIWDDHEVLNNWYPTEILGADMPHSEHSVALLAARAKRAFQEYTPMRFEPADPERIYRAIRFGPLVEIFGFDMRSYRGPNSTNRQDALSDESAILGPTQLEWLKRRLAASSATWKIIASDMPLALTVVDGPLFEAVANGDHGRPLGRELEIASLLRFIRDRRIRNVVFVTGDVHYCAAHHYDPARASFTEFHPFWEFVAGPAHAGTLRSGGLDRTFGPEVKFIGIPPGMKPNRPPSDGFQFFGTLRASAKTRALTVTLRNLEGRELYRVELEAERR